MNKLSAFHAISSNQLYAEVNSITEEGKPSNIYRVCHINSAADYICLICVTDPKPQFEALRLSTFRTNLEKRIFTQWKTDDYARSIGDEQELKLAEKTFKSIETLVHNVYDLCDRKTRIPLYVAAAQQFECDRRTIETRVIRYFVLGMTLSALVPYHENCGGKGKDKTAGEAMRGRPRKLDSTNEVKRPFNVTLEIAETMQRHWKKCLKSGKSPNDAYVLYCEKYYRIGSATYAGEEVPVFDDSRPTPSQFIYWCISKYGLGRKYTALKSTPNEYETNVRPIGGTHYEILYGPGSQYQIDATGALVSVVSPRNREIEIGKAILYFVIDADSWAVAGYSLTLENASFDAATVALGCAFSDKVQHCKRLGITIEPEEWPMQIICDEIYADQGPDLFGKQSDSVPLYFQLTWATAPRGRPDLRSEGERLNGEIKKYLTNLMTERNNALFTLEELEPHIVRVILTHNRTRSHRNHPYQIYLASEDLTPVPNNFWSWGCRNLTGIGRHMSEERVFIGLLHKMEVTVSEKGIQFYELSYFSRVMTEMLATLRLKGRKAKKVLIGYKPEGIGRIYLLRAKGTLEIVEICELTGAFAQFRNYSLWELLAERQATAGLLARAKKEAQEGHAAGMLRADQAMKQANELKQASGIAKTTYSDAEREEEKANQRRKRDKQHSELLPTPATKVAQIPTKKYANPVFLKNASKESK